jgi:hypothetical protein
MYGVAASVRDLLCRHAEAGGELAIGHVRERAKRAGK